eukprot:tig00021489_g21659.t1
MGAGSSSSSPRESRRDPAALVFDHDGVLNLSVTKTRGGGPQTFRTIEAAWAASVAAGAKRTRITVKEGEWLIKKWIDIDAEDKELAICGEGRAVLRSAKPLSTECIVFTGDRARVALRNLHVEGNISFQGKESSWCVRDCDLDGRGHWCLLAFSNCDRSRLSVSNSYLHHSEKRDAIIFRGQATSLRVVGCEIERCRSGVRCGDAEDSRVDIRGNQVHDSERGLLIFKPARGVVAENALWSCRWNVLQCARNGKEVESLPGLLLRANDVHPAAPRGVAPLRTGPLAAPPPADDFEWEEEDGSESCDSPRAEGEAAGATGGSGMVRVESSDSASDMDSLCPASSASSALPSPASDAGATPKASAASPPAARKLAAVDLSDIKPAPLVVCS